MALPNKSDLIKQRVAEMTRAIGENYRDLLFRTLTGDAPAGSVRTSHMRPIPAPPPPPANETATRGADIPRGFVRIAKGHTITMLYPCPVCRHLDVREFAWCPKCGAGVRVPRDVAKERAERRPDLHGVLRWTLFWFVVIGLVLGWARLMGWI